MNITELARILKVQTQELRDKLPQLCFDIGQKAIKVDDKIASRIINHWPILIKQLIAKEQAEKKETTAETAVVTKKKEIKIPNFITVRVFSPQPDPPIKKMGK